MTTDFELEIYVDDAGEYRWRLVSANGNNVATSGEGYKNRADCAHMARRILGDEDVVIDTSAAEA